MESIYLNSLAWFLQVSFHPQAQVSLNTKSVLAEPDTEDKITQEIRVKHHTLRRFMRILKLSIELTYFVITTEFDRSSNISPNNCKKITHYINQSECYVTANIFVITHLW